MISNRSDPFYRGMFIASTFCNLLGVGLAFPLQGLIFEIIGEDFPRPAVFLHTYMALAFAFGVGYYFIARDMYRNVDLVKTAVIGKSLMVALFGYHILFRGLHPFFLTPLVIDLAFAILYVDFLHHCRAHPRVPPAALAGRGSYAQ